MAKPKVISKDEHLDLARLWVFQNHKTVTEAAKQLGISRQTLTNALNGVTPMPATIYNALGYKAETSYVKEG